MAEIIPQYAVDASDAANQLHQHLSRMLGSGYRVVQHLQFKHSLNKVFIPSKRKRASLFWIQKSQQSLFIYISQSNKETAGININQRNQLADQIRHHPEIIQIHKLQRMLLPAAFSSHSASLVPFLIVFPESDNDSVQLSIRSKGLYLVGRQSIEPVSLLTFIRTHMGMPVSSRVFEFMRKIFNPELIIKANDALLDHAQEIALKSEIYLPPEARRSENYNLRVLNGGAGCGKTQILLQRARLLRKLYPMQKVLVLSHNQAIQQSIKSQYQQLNPNDRKIQIVAIYPWCKKRLNLTEKLVNDEDIQTVSEAVTNRLIKSKNLSHEQFMREINFIKGRLIFSEADYLAFNRNGQATSLDNIQRQDIWRAMLTLDNELLARNQMLWSNLPKLLFQSILEGKLLERYDHILVDEAQYFSPVNFELIKKSLKPHSGQLYITYDENQGFLNNRIHWKETGLDLRGHGMRLLPSYRMNTAILNAARAFHLNRLPEESDDIIVAPMRNTTFAATNNMATSDDNVSNPDLKPRLLHFTAVQDEQTRLLKDIHDLLHDTADKQHVAISAKDILVLTADSSEVSGVASKLESLLGLHTTIPTKNTHNADAMRVCALEYATGLESPIVFIISLQKLFENEKAANLTDRENYTLLMENTRKLYMGMTRATSQLTLMLTGEKIPQSLITPTIEIPTNNLQQQAKIRYLHG